MKEHCFDEGTIQSFLDGELSSDLLENVARHVSLCDNCALLLNEAENDLSFAFDILGEEFNTLVPTERIRANVYQAISHLEEPKISFWRKILNVRILSNPSIVAFASILIIVGLLATVWSFRSTTDLPKNKVAVIPSQKLEPTIPMPSNTPLLIVNEGGRENLPKSTKVVYKVKPKVQVQSAKVNNPRINKDKQTPKPENLVVPNLEGEDTYLKTIANLETTVNSTKDNVLRASSRVSYERDMAVIDNSIKRMKEEVRKNPKNEAAKQILRNSYQNKIELLNSVTDRSDLMARLD